ncbi:MAG: hypothetical protein ABJI22_12485, partial [Maribacter sp.]
KAILLFTALFFFTIISMAQENEKLTNVEDIIAPITMIKTIDDSNKIDYNFNRENSIDLGRLYQRQNNRVVIELMFVTKQMCAPKLS